MSENLFINVDDPTAIKPGDILVWTKRSHAPRLRVSIPTLRKRGMSISCGNRRVTLNTTLKSTVERLLLEDEDVTKLFLVDTVTNDGPINYNIYDLSISANAQRLHILSCKLIELPLVPDEKHIREIVTLLHKPNWFSNQLMDSYKIHPMSTFGTSELDKWVFYLLARDKSQLHLPDGDTKNNIQMPPSVFEIGEIVYKQSFMNYINCAIEQMAGKQLLWRNDDPAGQRICLRNYCLNCCREKYPDDRCVPYADISCCLYLKTNTLTKFLDAGAKLVRPTTLFWNVLNKQYWKFFESKSTQRFLNAKNEVDEIVKILLESRKSLTLKSRMHKRHEKNIKINSKVLKEMLNELA